MIPLNKIVEGCAFKGLKTLPDNCVDTCVTSPPYYGLRNYGIAKTHWPACKVKIIFGFEIEVPAMECCLGEEAKPEYFIAHMVLIFDEVRRVLKKEGTLWLNLGDSYANSSNGNTGMNNGFNERWGQSAGLKKQEQQSVTNRIKKVPEGIKPKDLIGIPWAVAFALRSSGWYLSQDIIWHKPNPMPESITDRCTKAHEYIFLFSKSAKYYYNAESIATPYQDKTLTTYGCEVKGKGDGSGLIQSENWANSIEVRKPKVWKTPDGWDTGDARHGAFHKNGREKGKSVKEKTAESYGLNGTGFQGHSGNYSANGELLGSGKANKRSVWTVTTQPYAEAHFATFPEDLIVDCIKAGCPEGGVVLDPFGGAGTTALVSAKLNCNYILFEIKKEYIKISDRRLHQHLGFFNPAQ